MGDLINIEIDGQIHQVKKDINLVEALKELEIYIPTLCYFKDMGKCLGTCRVCSIRVNGRVSASCTLQTKQNMQLEVNTPDLIDMRKELIELLFVEGNHYCPGCERSGNCELQATAYEMEMLVSRFHYRFNLKSIDYQADNILFDHNRCILCKRCSRRFWDQDGQRVFYFNGRGSHLKVEMDIERANMLSIELLNDLVELCPVGAILKKGEGFSIPYGKRKYDKTPRSQCRGDQNE